jgi:GNAT superfamily N-acetyltransferase
MNDRYQLITPASHPDFCELVDSFAHVSWPEFMLHDPVAGAHWGDLFDCFPEYQFGLLDNETGRTVAQGNSVPLHWDGDLDDLPERGWDWALEQAAEDHQNGLEPHTQCAIQIVFHPDYRGQGLSARMVQAMREIGIARGLVHLIAPIRPNQKSLYPLTPIDRYITWKTADGLPFDAWLRVHVRLGGRIIKPCHAAMTIGGTLTEWKSWTGMEFPESGGYVVPGALTPINVNMEADRAVYVEPNVWTVHELR